MQSPRALSSPQLLPDGNSMLLTAGVSGRWDDAQIVVESLKAHARKVVVSKGTNGTYLTSGHIAYVRDGVMYAVPFDVATLEARGGPVAVVEGVSEAGGFGGGARQKGAAQVAISASGTLAYVPSIADSMPKLARRRHSTTRTFSSSTISATTAAGRSSSPSSSKAKRCARV